ncbi:MAG: response regulator [Candidatus Omnitrophica bacterium]|nr:response regulator [Candidatus Omnitrophota bacterium]
MLLSKKTVLIIEDEHDLLEMIQYYFRAKGFKTFIAHDGKEGLEVLDRQRPDIIILDLNMPRMGGIEFYHRICGPSGRPQYPVLIMTARANTKRLFLDLEVDGFMTKPVDIDQLLKEAEIIIDRKNRWRRLGRDSGQPMNLVIVEDEYDELEKIQKVFDSRGYQIQYIHSGVDAIEQMNQKLPDAALIKLNLADIPGDLLALRLNYMPKTAGILSLVYTHGSNLHIHSVLDKLANKSGVCDLIEFYDYEQLVESVDRMFQKLK